MASLRIFPTEKKHIKYKILVREDTINFILILNVDKEKDEKINIIVKSDDSYFYDTESYNPNYESEYRKIVESFLLNIVNYNKKDRSRLNSLIEFDKVPGLYDACKCYAEVSIESEKEFDFNNKQSTFIDMEHDDLSDLYPSSFNLEKYYEQKYEKDEKYDGQRKKP